MASEVIALLRVQMSEELRLGAITHGRDVGRDALTYIASVVLVAVVFGSVLYMFMDSLSQMGLADRIPLMVAFISVSASLGFAFFRGTHAFVFDDYDLVMSMPVGSTHVAMSRYLSVYIVSAAIGLFLTLVSIPAMADHYSMGSMVAFAASVLIGSLIPASLGTALGTIVSRAGSMSSHKGATSVIALVAIVAVLAVLIDRMSGEVEGSDLVASLGDAVPSVCPPAAWIAGWADWDVPSVILLVMTSLASATIVVLAASRCLKALNSENRSTVRKASSSESRASGRMSSLYRRDVRRYVTSRIYITNTAVGMLLLVVLSYMIAYTDGLDTSELGQLMPLLTSVLPLFVSFFVALSCTTSVSLSMEGQTRWILGSSPLRPWDIFLSKILVNLTVVIPLELLSVAILATGMGVSGMDLALLIAVPTAYALFTPALGMVMNIRYPRYDWSSEYYAVKGGSMSMLGTVGVGLASVIVPLIASGATQRPDLVMCVTAAIVLMLAVVLYLHLRRTGLYFY